MNIFTWIITLCIIYAPGCISYAIKRVVLRQSPEFPLKPNAVQLIAGILYVIARILPEPITTDESITLAQHFVGGGFVSTLYFIYFIREFNITLSFLARFGLLYMFVSTMGVTNELLEFTASKTGIYPLDGSDVWWDLVANTSGAYLLLLLWELYYWIKRKKGNI